MSRMDGQTTANTSCLMVKQSNVNTQTQRSTGIRNRARIAYKLEMLANAQRDGRPAEYRWRPLFNAAKFG